MHCMVYCTYLRFSVVVLILKPEEQLCVERRIAQRDRVRRWNRANKRTCEIHCATLSAVAFVAVLIWRPNDVTTNRLQMEHYVAPSLARCAAFRNQ